MLVLRAFIGHFTSPPFSLGGDALVGAEIRSNALNSAVAGVQVTEVTVAAEGHRVGEGRVHSHWTSMQAHGLVAYLLVRADFLGEGREDVEQYLL